MMTVTLSQSNCHIPSAQQRGDGAETLNRNRSLLIPVADQAEASQASGTCEVSDTTPATPQPRPPVTVATPHRDRAYVLLQSRCARARRFQPSQECDKGVLVRPLRYDRGRNRTMQETLDAATLPSAQETYSLERQLRSGAFGRIYVASERRTPDKRVAVEVYEHAETTSAVRRRRALEQYAVLSDSHHPNLVQFLGAFGDRDSGAGGAFNVWFVLELCWCSARELVGARLANSGHRMSEEHIAYILKGVIKALTYLDEKSTVHRDVRAANVLLSGAGEVKLSGFMLARRAQAAPDAEGGGSSSARLPGGAVSGSPAWVAPEVATGAAYDTRADVWALGITAIELADGRAPCEDMHPSRALFQAARNPPPTLERPSSWSNTINDFICECLEKNPENRPFVMELAEHPLIQSVPENDYYLSQELKKLALELCPCEGGGQCGQGAGGTESALEDGGGRRAGGEPEPVYLEDLAALEPLSEDTLLQHVQLKWRRGLYASYIGDTLLMITPPSDHHQPPDDVECHKKYECRSRSDNEPHIFGVVDAAYQSALHHDEPQHIVLCGESGTGKSEATRRALSHLVYLEGGMAIGAATADRILRAAEVLRVASAAATTVNAHSTRCVVQTQVTYSRTGKLSGAIFWLYQLEKWRVASTDMTQANFDLLYYFYDAMESRGRLEELELESGRRHRYLRVRTQEMPRAPQGARETPAENVRSYGKLLADLASLEWEERDRTTLERVLAAILALGDVRFREGEAGAELENAEQAAKVARLLELERVKFSWALLKYCVVQRGTALQRRHSADEARDARDTLAATLYKRLLDYLVNRLNLELSFGRAVFGDKYSISVLDMFGFECFRRNRLEQLIVNTTNEQMQFLYNQRTFAWETTEAAEDGVQAAALRFYDNKTAVDQLMGRPHGLFYILDEASRASGGLELIISTIRNGRKGPHVKLSSSQEFSVAHYAGTINYDAREMADKNRDFLPPEMIETMRASTSDAVRALFRNKLTRTGNLTLDARQRGAGALSPTSTAVRLTKADKNAENVQTRKFNTVSRGQWSQLHRMRTAAATYRATSLELLRQLSVGAGSGGVHFVKCVRCDLAPAPRARSFQPDLVRHQMRALQLLDTARARRQGFPCRVPFAEFIKRYKFLAFDFEETVSETRDNCRLLLIRLKMEGWQLGSTKVFLTYYNEEFLARLYERQVKKIVKVQCMMRAFLARRKAAQSKSKKQHVQELKKQQSANTDEDEAALLIQKAYRGYVVRKAYGPLVSQGAEQIDEQTAGFLKRFALKWKSRSVFQVLLQYRAVRYQDLVHFAQQVHIYNQETMSVLRGATLSGAVRLERVDAHAREAAFLGAAPPSVGKLPFRLHCLQYLDTAHMCQPASPASAAHTRDTFACQNDSDQETWDEPLRSRTSGAGRARRLAHSEDVAPPGLGDQDAAIIHLPYCRDPAQPITKLPEEKPAARSDESVARPSVYKKKQTAPMYQPPTPWSARESGLDSGERAPHHLQNPVRELQQLARSRSGGECDDDAPYNFQAMLKKTPRNRASMKRSGEGEEHAAWKRVEYERVQLAPGLSVEGEVADL